jgi:hypothetical protein
MGLPALFHDFPISPYEIQIKTGQWIDIKDPSFVGFFDRLDSFGGITYII